MGAATGNGDLPTVHHAMPVAGIDDGITGPAAADLASLFEPAHQLLVDLERYPVEVGQQCLAVDSLFPKALADPVLLL